MSRGRASRALSFAPGAEDSPPPRQPDASVGGTSPGTRQSIATLHDENLALLDEIRGERRDAVRQRTDLAAMLTDEQQRASLQRTELAAMISDEQARANAQRTDLAKMLADEQHRAQMQRDHIRQQVEQTDAKLDHVIAMSAVLSWLLARGARGN